MKILYFTATGNSLAVAKVLGGELFSIPTLVQQSVYEMEDDKIGLVFPLYCMQPPKMVREFLSRAKFKTDYIFAIGTYGNGSGAFAERLQNMVRPYGYQINYIRSVLMVDNYLPVFEIGQEIEKIPQKKIDENLNSIKADIEEGVSMTESSNIIGRMLYSVCQPMVRTQDKGLAAQKFIVDDKCIGCGICSKVCPANNITIDGKPSFAGKCESCYACIHACPQRAIHLKNEKSSKRWRHPDVTLDELVNANHQYK